MVRQGPGQAAGRNGPGVALSGREPVLHQASRGTEGRPGELGSTVNGVSASDQPRAHKARREQWGGREPGAPFRQHVRGQFWPEVEEGAEGEGNAPIDCQLRKSDVVPCPPTPRGRPQSTLGSQVGTEFVAVRGQGSRCPADGSVWFHPTTLQTLSRLQGLIAPSLITIAM